MSNKNEISKVPQHKNLGEEEQNGRRVSVTDHKLLNIFAAFKMHAS